MPTGGPEDRTADTGVGDWPAVEGVDLNLARLRACNSPELFAELLALTQLIYGSWSETWMAQARKHGPGIAKELGASLHKLQGSAATIGACRLVELASQGEAALLNGQAEPLRVVASVGSTLNRLLLSIANLTVPPPASPDHKVDRLALVDQPDQLLELLELLKAKDLDSLDVAREYVGALTELLGGDGMRTLQQTIDQLDFDTAHARLKESLAAMGKSNLGS